MSFVCIVDDDASIRSALANLLKSAGYATVTFSSGEAFLAASDIDDALCVLLDLKMQGMQGLDVQRQLNQQQRSVPIVIMSAHGDETIVRQALSQGASGFLHKPFPEDALLDLIALAAGRKGADD
ncbi:response regulator transcription factor [Paraburkholderia sp. BCC1884]|uniref:response regulator transcription factor n=1 Tax=Paraburkholderia sp. BCC1884 TaxID=2562668 RepID=UPI0011836107|nr:response regulator [Paraburkholderia sp. BCC1884]